MGGLLVVVLTPVLVACTLAVRLSGPGPILFRQRRVGRNGWVFHMHKFRSMVRDAEKRQPALRAVGNKADGPLFKLRRDPRVTRVGRVLRAWCLDELPRLFDVLRGGMSLVGPRPLVTHEVDLSDPWARIRLRVKPVSPACGRSPAATACRSTTWSATTCSTSRTGRSPWTCASCSTPSRRYCSAQASDQPG